MLNKKIIILLILLSLSLVIVACSNNSNDLTVEDEAYGLKVALDLPAELLNEVKLQTIEEQIMIHEIEVVIKDQAEDVIEEETIYNDSESAKNYQEIEVIMFEGIEADHNYQIEVQLKGTIRDQDKVKTLYEGSTESGQLQAGTLVEVEVEVEPLNAQSLTVEITNDDVAVKNLTLSHQTEDNIEVTKKYDGGVTFNDGDSLDVDGEGEIDFIPTRWLLSVELENGKQGDNYDLLLLPNEKKHLELEVDENTADIKTTVNVPSSIEKIEDLKLNDKQELSWSGTGDSYAIYSSRIDDPDTRQYITGVDSEVYQDVVGGRYYWVRAYDEHGYASALSETSVFVEAFQLAKIAEPTDLEVEFGSKQYYAMQDLEETIIVTDNQGNDYLVALEWSIENYNGNQVGDYTATGTFDLPAGVENTELELELEVEATVTVTVIEKG